MAAGQGLLVGAGAILPLVDDEEPIATRDDGVSCVLQLSSRDFSFSQSAFDAV